MIMDALLLLDGSVSAAGVLSGTVINTSWANPPTTTTYYSANVIDVSQLASSASGLGRDIGIGDDPGLQLVVMAPVAVCGSSGSSTLVVALQAAPDSSGSPGSYVTLASTGVLTASGTSPYPIIAAGAEVLRIAIPISAGAAAPKFYRVAYTIAGAALATGGTGQIIACIVLDRTALGPLMGYQSGYSNAYI
ncbi:MAG: hypothetical protein ABSG91_07075 [Syntrophobacteraceae bacterium]|jgi:hypothetical protein